MNDLTKKDYVNILIEGAAMFFVLLPLLFSLDQNLSFSYREELVNAMIVIPLFQFIVTWICLLIRRIHYRFVAVLAYTFIVSITFYAIASDNDTEELTFLVLLFITMVAAWAAVRHVHYQYYKDKFDLHQHLSKEQAYSVIGLLTFIQGASPSSAYSNEANKIVRSMIAKLDLSQQDIENYFKSSLDSDPEECINRIISSLKEIQDYDFIQMLYEKCMKIADISDNKKAKEMINTIFSELKA